MLLSHQDIRLTEPDLRLPQLLYHAAPIHYLPLILQMGFLLAASNGLQIGVVPRRSAKRRDRMLGLDRYVHLALDQVTPLLRDKLGKGMPHVVLEFDGNAVFHSYRCAALPYNTKAWRTKAEMRPIDDYDRIANMLHSRARYDRYHSMEILVPGRLSLDYCVQIQTFSGVDHRAVEDMIAAIGSKHRIKVMEAQLQGMYGGCADITTFDYIRQCIRSGEALSIPSGIEFD